MTTGEEARPPRRKKSLRRRMIVSLTGLALLPLLIALTSLFFVVRNDIGENQGQSLVRDAVQLTEKLRAELRRYPQTPVGQEVPTELQKFLELSREGNQKEVVLFTTDGHRLAGNPGIPVPPTTEGETAWITFEAGGESYFAGIAKVGLSGDNAPRNWNLAIVQPSAQVYRHLHSVSSQAAFFMIAFVILVATLAWWMANQYMRPILEIRDRKSVV